MSENKQLKFIYSLEHLAENKVQLVCTHVEYGAVILGVDTDLISSKDKCHLQTLLEKGSLSLNYIENYKEVSNLRIIKVGDIDYSGLV